MRTYWVYILASRPYGTLYIGVTNNLLGRVQLHREGNGAKFTSRYAVGKLVHFEPFSAIETAIQREKSLKRYRRQWKINLIEQNNPHWIDLYPQLPGHPKDHKLRPGGEIGPRDKPEDDN